MRSIICFGVNVLKCLAVAQGHVILSMDATYSRTITTTEAFDWWKPNQRETTSGDMRTAFN
jgi:hypothetical protein